MLNKLKLFAITAVAIVMVLPLGAHPGPERHPVEQELFDVEDRLNAKITQLEQRLSRMNTLIESVSEPDEDTIADAVQAAMVGPVGEIDQSLNELKDSVAGVVANTQMHLWWLIAVSAVMVLGFIVMFAYVNAQLKKST